MSARTEVTGRSEALLLISWGVALCVASQFLYIVVWRGEYTFVYDAMTTFSPWNVARLADLRDGTGMLAMFQPGLPAEIWPSYYFSGLLRQIAALVQPNTPQAHAVVQALHGVLFIPAAALLFRSFGTPMQYGLIGGVVFALSGIHVSLTQHVLSYEALLYLILSLLGVRQLLLTSSQSQPWRWALWFAVSAVMLMSLTRLPHESALYAVPLAAWALGHLLVLWRHVGWQAARRGSIALAGLLALVVLAAGPMLLTAYELSLTNKTLVRSYEDLGPHFADLQVFLMALLLPNFTGGASSIWPPPFGFGQEATLSYLFAGSMTAACAAVTVVGWWRAGRRRGAVTIALTLVVLTAYAFGGGLLHRALTLMFPFLVDIGHAYYALHLLYLLTGYCVAESIRLIWRGAERMVFVIVQLSTACIALLAGATILVHQRFGLTGSVEAYGSALIHDGIWLILVSAGALLLCGCLAWVQRSSVWGRVGVRHLASWVLIVGFGCLVVADLLRGSWNAHFVPSERWIASKSDPLGGFNMSRSIVDYLREHTQGSSEPLRLVPLFIRPGGWQSNALLPLNVHLVSTPADTGGNRFIADTLDRTPDQALLSRLVTVYGVEMFWVARWEMDAWAAVLAASEGLELVHSAPYGGDLYRVKPGFFKRTGSPAVGWDDPAITSSQGLVTRVWSYPMPPADGEGRSTIVLPRMWHAGFSVRLPDGSTPGTTASEDGLLEVLATPTGSGSVFVRYPSRPLAAVIWTAALVTALSTLALLVLLAIQLVKWRTGSRDPA